MSTYPSDAPTPELAALFPTVIPDVETYVYDYVKAATTDGLASGVPALSFYADRARSATEGRHVAVRRGWPVYPGEVPAIGISAGPEGEDQQHQTIAGGFVADVVHRDPTTGAVVGSASYYSEALVAHIAVVLIHENRDERNRLHNELRRVLFPIRRHLLEADPQIRQVTVDAEMTEQDSGPEDDVPPFTIYASVYTVHVVYEMLEATNVQGTDSVLARIDVTVQETDGRP